MTKRLDEHNHRYSCRETIGTLEVSSLHPTSIHPTGPPRLGRVAKKKAEKMLEGKKRGNRECVYVSSWDLQFY